MPEGHTTHRLAQRHQQCYAGTPVAVSSPQGRFAAAAASVDGRVLLRAEAHGKHLFHVYGPDLVVHVHLGLYGAFTEAAVPVQPARGQVRMRMVGRTHWTDLRGPTACELLTEDETDALHARLGPDPLIPGTEPDRAWARISRSRAPLATLLTDQSVVAGVGTVYSGAGLFGVSGRVGVTGCYPRQPRHGIGRYLSVGARYGSSRRGCARYSRDAVVEAAHRC